MTKSSLEATKPKSLALGTHVDPIKQSHLQIKVRRDGHLQQTDVGVRCDDHLQQTDVEVRHDGHLQQTDVR
jgi:hypothetical protein